MRAQPTIRILFYTRQPFVALGLATAFGRNSRLRILQTCDTFPFTIQQLRAAKPDVFVMHLSGRPSLAELARAHSQQPGCPIVLWGDDPGGEFAVQAMHLGVKAFLPSETPVSNLLASLVSVHDGVLCFGKSIVRKVMAQQRVALTRRQGQLVWLVAQGCKNKAIAARLGITEGTVKVYIYKLFKKLGVNDRLQMALYALEHLGGAQPGRAPEFSLGADCGRMDEIFSPQSLPAHSLEDLPLNRIN